MNSAALAKLQRLLDAARAAEAARLFAVLAQAASCRRRAEHLRSQIGIVSEGAVSHTIEGNGHPLVLEPAANLWAELRWSQRLAQQADEENAQAAALEIEAEAIRPRVAHAFGRYTVAGAMAENARAVERRLAESRAEAAIIASWPSPDQLLSSGSASVGTSAGSPGKE